MESMTRSGLKGMGNRSTLPILYLQTPAAAFIALAMAEENACGSLLQRGAGRLYAFPRELSFDKPLHSLAVALRHVNPSLPITRHAGWQFELPRRGPFRAP